MSYDNPDNLSLTSAQSQRLYEVAMGIWHPSVSDLLGFTKGLPTEVSRDNIEEHLDTCAECKLLIQDPPTEEELERELAEICSETREEDRCFQPGDIILWDANPVVLIRKVPECWHACAITFNLWADGETLADAVEALLDLVEDCRQDSESETREVSPCLARQDWKLGRLKEGWRERCADTIQRELLLKARGGAIQLGLLSPPK